MSLFNKNKYSFIKRNSLFIKVLIAFILICAILLSALSLLLFNKYSENSVKELYNASLGMLNQTFITVDAQLSGVYNYFSWVYQKDTIVFNALYALRYNEFEMYDINKKLNEYVKNNPLVESVYIYNRDSGYVFSSKTTVQRIESFYDKDIIGYIKRNTVFNDPLYIPRNVKYNIYEYAEDLKLVSIIFCQPNYGQSPSSAMVVNINRDYLERLISWSPFSGSGEKFIVNDKGMSIVSTNAILLKGSVAEQPFFKKIKSIEKESGHFNINIDKKKHYISFYKSSGITEWYYITKVSYSSLLSKTREIRDFVFIATGIFIVFAAIISLFVILRLYKPFYTLLKSIKSRTASMKSGNSMSELEFIDQAFSGLNANIDDLKSKLNIYRDAKKREFLEKLLQGQIKPKDNIISEIDNLNLSIKGEMYLVCIFKIDNYLVFSRSHSSEDVALYRFALANIANEILQDIATVEAYDGMRDYAAVIISMNDSEPSSVAILEACDKIKEALNLYMGISVTISFGNAHTGFDGIHKSFEEAVFASERRITRGKGAVIKYSEAWDELNHEYTYPSNTEGKVLENLKLEDTEGLFRAIVRFAEDVRQFSSEEIRLSLAQLSMSMMRAATQISGIKPSELGIQGRDFLNKITMMETIDEMVNWIKELGELIFLAMLNSRGRKKDDMVTKIFKYVESNYSDPILAVESIADLVGLSPNHLRLVFKENTGKSLSVYINYYRIEKSKEFLANTNYSIKKISEMVGMTNTNYFYTNFKKHTGYSPEQYRKGFQNYSE